MLEASKVCEPPDDLYSCIIGAVKHDSFRGLCTNSMLINNGVSYDIKGTLIKPNKRL